MRLLLTTMTAANELEMTNFLEELAPQSEVPACKEGEESITSADN